MKNRYKTTIKTLKKEMSEKFFSHQKIIEEPGNFLRPGVVPVSDGIDAESGIKKEKLKLYKILKLKKNYLKFRQNSKILTKLTSTMMSLIPGEFVTQLSQSGQVVLQVQEEVAGLLNAHPKLIKNAILALKDP